MLTPFRQWLAPPVFEADEDKTRRAKLLHTVLITSSLVTLIMIGGGLLGNNSRPATYGVLGITLGTLAGLGWLMRRGQVGLASVGCSLMLSLFTTLALASQGSVRTPGVVFFLLASVMAGLLISQRAAVGSAAVNSLIVFGLIGAEQNGWLPPPILSITITQGITFAAGSIFTVVLVNVAIQSIDQALASARRELAERQQTEVALHAAEARYRELVERLPVVVYSSETGAAGRWLYVSPQIESLLGFTADEWLADPQLWFRQMHADDREPTLRTEAQALAASQPVHMEYRLAARDGHIVWLRDECTQAPSPAGQPTRVQGLLMDITARKQAEQTAQRQLAELKILQAVATGIATARTEDQLLEGVTSIIGSTFYPADFGVMLWEEALQRLRIPASYRSRNPQHEPYMPAGRGILNWVAMTGQSRRAANVRQDPHYHAHSTTTESELCVPIKIGERVLGIINAESDRLDAFSEADERLLLTIAGQLATALERLHAEAAQQHYLIEINEALTREQRFNNFVRAISRRLDIPVVLEMAVRRAAELVGAESGSLCLMSADQTAIVEVYDFNPPPNMDSHRLPRQRGLVWRTFQTRAPLLVDEYAQHPEALPEWAAAGLRAYMTAPVSTSEKQLGVITLYNRKSDKHFTSRDLALAESIGRQVAVSLENALLFAAEQRRVGLLTALHETGLDLSAQLDLPVLLQIIMQRAAHLLGATMGGFYLAEPDGETLTHMANLPIGNLGPPVKIGEGVVGRVAQSADPLIVDDYTHWPGRLSETAPFCGVVSVPILWQNRVVGVISICDPKPGRFGPDDIESVRLLAAQAAVAITNARLYAARQQELAERQRAEAALRQRDAILEAVTFAAEQFLKTADWQAEIARVLERLGQKINASHVYIFENHLTEAGMLVTSQRHEWVAPGQRPEIDNPLFQNSPIEEPGFERWTAALRQGEPFYGNLSSFLPTEAEFLTPRGIRALLDVPIYVGEVWWGIIGFDDCVVDREWSLAELDTLKLAASIISAAIQRQQAEAALRDNEALLRAIIDNIPFDLWVCDAQDRYILQNPISIERAGRLIGKTVSELNAPPQVRAYFAEKDRRALSGETIHEEVETLIQGERRYLLNVHTPIRRDEHLLGFVGMNIDLTERKRAEEAIHQLNTDLERRVLERTAQLEATNRELEAFSYSVSHDLRAPLRAVNGFARMLEEEHLHHLSPEAQRLLSRIQENAQRMSQLIDDLLNLSRLTRAQLHRQPIQLSHLAREACLAQQQREPHRRVEWQIEPALTAYGDPNLLKIVLENLLSNAWKFTAQRPQAHIEVGSQLQSNGERAFFVRDNGAGFDMRYADKLFGAFQRLHHPDEFEGTGIGLATVQRIIHRHGGRVWATGAVDQGATFYFTLSGE